MVSYGFAAVASLLAFALAACLSSWVRQQPPGGKEVNRIGGLIAPGARTFLRRE